MTDASKVRFCSACQKNRPAGTFRWFRAGVGGYHIEVEVCDYCKEGLVHAIISYGVRASDVGSGDALTQADHRVAILEAQLAEAAKLDLSKTREITTLVQQLADVREELSQHCS